MKRLLSFFAIVSVVFVILPLFVFFDVLSCLFLGKDAWVSSVPFFLALSFLLMLNLVTAKVSLGSKVGTFIAVSVIAIIGVMVIGVVRMLVLAFSQ